MNKQRFVISIGFGSFFLFLVMISLLGSENPEVGFANQPSPVRAPAAISAPARATPTSTYSKQLVIQPVPQPVPTPARMSAVNDAPPAPNPLPYLLFGMLLIGALSLIIRWAFRLNWQHSHNGRSTIQSSLAKGVHS